MTEQELLEFESDPKFKATIARMNSITTLEDLSFHLSEFFASTKDEYKFEDLLASASALQNRVLEKIREIENASV